jgi:Uma2 family endonuclease
MSTAIHISDLSAIEYPDSDGLPMSENSVQNDWMFTIKGGLSTLLLNDPNVFVACDLLWYPVQGDPTTRIALDAMVVFGRPKGRRGSYKQWEEGNQPPHVVFEVLAPGNRPGEMERKLRFYDQYGVEEYYAYDPDVGSPEGWRRMGSHLEEIPRMAGYVSPRLGIRFDPGDGPDNLKIIGPDGARFLTFDELHAKSKADERRADHETRRADLERARAEEQARIADAERGSVEEQTQLAAAERERAEAERQRAEAERERAEAADQRADRLAARLRELGIEPE